MTNKTAQEIYDQYEIPQNLREHMLRSAYLALLLIEKWKGPEIDRNLIISTLLLHDMGNVVKFDFTSLTVSDEKPVEYWKNLQEDIIKKYGIDDHIATSNILYELGVSSEIRQLALNKIFILNERTDASQDYNLKLCSYVDQRIAPDRVMPLMDRLAEAKERSKGKPTASMNHPRIDYLMQSAANIEKQILTCTEIDELSMPSIVESKMHKLLSFEIKVA